MIVENGLSVVTVKKTELLEAIRKNREQHRSTFLRALEGYKKAVISELEKSLAEAREGKRFARHIALVEPSDHTRDYDRIIRMLEMSVKDEISVSETEFAQFVLDDWAWKNQFIASTSAYMDR